jgi:hypothetical protein
MAFAATNNSASTLTSFTLGFQWGAVAERRNTSPQTMVLEYGFGATFDAVAWTAPGGTFNWASPVVGATAAGGRQCSGPGEQPRWDDQWSELVHRSDALATLD